MPAPSAEATAIDAAYQDHIQVLFVGLCTNLEQGHSDQQSVAAFNKGYNILKHARDLALSAVGASPATAIAMRRPKPKRT